MLNHAHNLDCDVSDGSISHTGALNAIAREARAHGCLARVSRAGHVLVTSPEGATLATRSAVRLASWLGY